LFRLFGFIYPGDVMRHIRFACLYSKSEDKVAAAIELLEDTLQRENHAALLPIFENISLDRRVAELEKTFPGRAADTAQRIRELLAGECGCGSRWLAAVALEFIGRHADLARAVRVPDDERMAAARAWILPPAGTERGRMPVIQRVIALKRSSIFAAVPEEVLSEFAPQATESVFAAAAPILRAGEFGSTLGVIVEGSVRIFRGQQTLAELGPGGVFGELAALSPEPRTANVTAVSETRVLELSAEAVERMIAARGEAAEGIIRVLCERIQTSIREKTFADTGSYRIPRDAPATTGPARMLQDLEKVVWLRKVEIFSSLSDTILLHLARLATEQWLDEGAALFQKGDLGTSLYIVVEGEMAVHEDGRLIATLRPGEILGELALLTSEVRSTSVAAKTPARLLKITQSVVQELMWDHYQMTRGMIRILVQRLRAMMVGPGAAAGETTT
jgi:CRP-like cAMP-binding protein